VQEDPAGYGGSANLYAYADGQALEATDPGGLMKLAPRQKNLGSPESWDFTFAGGGSTAWFDAAVAEGEAYTNALMDDEQAIAGGARGCLHVLCATEQTNEQAQTGPGQNSSQVHDAGYEDRKPRAGEVFWTRPSPLTGQDPTEHGARDYVNSELGFLTLQNGRTGNVISSRMGEYNLWAARDDGVANKASQQFGGIPFTGNWQAPFTGYSGTLSSQVGGWSVDVIGATNRITGWTAWVVVNIPKGS
jgi:hypothetical protein